MAKFPWLLATLLFTAGPALADPPEPCDYYENLLIGTLCQAPPISASASPTTTGT